MADRTINATFIPRRDTAANWESENPVLREGEYISVTTNAGAIRHKVGDGVKTYNQLPFIDEPLYNAMSDKADKVSNPTSGNFAALDSNGNLTDSGHKHSDYLTSHQDISGKQDTIEVDGILEGDGEGNISAAETQEVTTLSIDNVPTPDSINLVKSGGVWTAIQNASGGGGDIASTTSVLKGDGNGGAVAATAGTDYQAPLVAGTDYAEPSDIPTKISDLQNDSGFISSYTETDPTVPSWAKATTKPTYTASEVGAAESSHVHGNITNGGDITATAPTIASGDQIIINDHSASKITNGPTFDGSTTSKYLSQKGTWESVPTVSYPVTSVNSKTGAVVLSNTDVGAAATSHTHGNIQNGGTLQTSDITIANGDKLVVTDSSDSSKVARASISFDGSTTSKYLSQKGTWENTPTAASIGALTSESDPVFSASAAAGISSTDISNWNAKQNALTIDSTPTNGSGNPVSSDGTYDMVMSRTKIYTASCSTAASTTAKVATLDDSTGFSLSAGVMVAVRFTYGNSAATPTLNVNSTGAKTIAIPSSATAYTTGSGTTYNTWGAYETILFTYTGTYWAHLPSGYLGYLAYNLASNALPSSTSIPTKVSDLQNDSGFITSYTETDPTVPSWAKASSKPSYTASEVGAAPTSHASTATTYGAGTSSNYGHVKLSDSTSSTSSTTGGIAATPAAVKAAYDLANGKQDPLPSQTNNSGKFLTTNGTTLSWGLDNKTWYGTCSTTASTAEKAVTCSGYVLQTGTIVGVLFTTANTASTGQSLNINSTGAKSIYIGNTSTNSTTNVLKWSSNTMVYFMYDGTYYRYITSISDSTVAPSRGANTWYGISSTSASTQAKTSTIDNFVLTIGSVVYITFSTANTYTSAKITLNINSTGAKDVYYNNTVTSSTNTLLWDAGETLTFIYTGSYYYFIGKSTLLPSQSGNSGKFLTTDGSRLSWGESGTNVQIVRW